MTLSCYGDDQYHIDSARLSQPIIAGSPSTNEDDDVILLLYRSDSENKYFLCTGVLLSPHILATARHCVTRTFSPSVDCSSNRKDNLDGDYNVKNYTTFAGKKYDENEYQGENYIGVSKIIHSGGPDLCGDDIAFIVLNDGYESIAPAVIATVPPSTEDDLEAVGWGITLDENRYQNFIRYKRSGLKLLKEKSYENSEFVVSEGSCSGDSGGPIRKSGTGITYGLLSRGTATNPASQDKRPGAHCLGAMNTYTFIHDKMDLLNIAIRETGDSVRLSSGGSCSIDKCTIDDTLPQRRNSAAYKSGTCSFHHAEDTGHADSFWLSLSLLLILSNRYRAIRRPT